METTLFQGRCIGTEGGQDPIKVESRSKTLAILERTVDLHPYRNKSPYHMESINYLINFVLIVAAALTAWLPAEAAEPMRDPSGEPARQIELDPGVTPKSDRPAVVLERGPDHRVVEWYSEILDESGTSLTLTNRYTEVATGLHFLDAKGEWYETVAAFEEVPNGWVAARGPHQVALSTDLSVPGSVTVVTVDGVTLRSTPTLLAYVDRSTGQEVHLASLRPTRGELILPGTVLYPNAFDAVAADVRAIYTAAGFECDVILRGALPNPAEFGLNPDTTDLDGVPCVTRTAINKEALIAARRIGVARAIWNTLLIMILRQ